MPVTSSQWAEYKQEVLARIPDFGQHYARLEKQKQSTDGWVTALCPFHEDTNPSFAFERTTGNWKCHGECGQGSVFDFEAKDRGLSFKDAMFAIGDELEVPRPNADSVVSQEYAYTDAEGKLLFQVVRKPGKKFSQRRPDGNGVWVWNLKGVERVLYRLPDLNARPDDLVYIVEGEKDADRLSGLGLLATTNSGGAGKWKDEYSDTLANRNVVVLPDNDEAGRKHSEQVARSLGERNSSAKILKLPGLTEKGDVSDWLDAGGSAEELQALVEETATWEQKQQGTVIPRIQLSGKQLHEVLEDVWKAIIEENDPPSLFLSSGSLARVEKDRETARIDLLDGDKAYGLLIRLADWYTQRGEHEIHSKPPKDVARDLLANPNPLLPQLEGVITTPIFDKSWSLLNQPGYHPGAKIWFQRPQSFEELTVPAIPSKEEVAKARSLILDDLLFDFPFKSDSDETHAFAALLLPFARRMFDGPTPIHMIEAPTPGSGKSLLAELISIIAQGGTPSCTTLTKNEEESRKKLTAILLTGPMIVSIDNIEGGLWSSQFAAAITAPQWEDRILGKSQMVKFPNQALWMVSGNNPKLSLEIVRRCIRIRLNPHEERPWMRTGFKHEQIRDWAKQNRLELVQSLLLIIQNWIVSGAPPSTKTLGSFDTWSKCIGGIVEHLGLPGFLEDTEEFYAVADPETEEWRAFILAWWTKHDCAPVAPALLLELALEENLIPFAYMGSSDRAQLAKFGKALLRIRDRKFAGYEVFAQRNSHRGSNDYRLIPEPNDLFSDTEVV